MSSITSSSLIVVYLTFLAVCSISRSSFSISISSLVIFYTTCSCSILFCGPIGIYILEFSCDDADPSLVILLLEEFCCSQSCFTVISTLYFTWLSLLFSLSTIALFLPLVSALFFGRVCLVKPSAVVYMASRGFSQMRFVFNVISLNGLASPSSVEVNYILSIRI